LTGTSYPSVVHVLWAGHMGGIQRLVHDLSAEQTRIGMDVTVAFGQARGLFADRIRNRGIRVVDLGLRSGYDIRPHKLSRAAEMLATSDVVHAHGPINVPMAAVMRRSGRPIVFTHHGLIFTQRGESARGRRVGVRGAVSRRSEHRFLRGHRTVVVANSHWTAERVGDIYGIAREDVTVVHNGIETSGVAMPAEREATSGLTVAFVGRLVRFKRVDRIIRAVGKGRHPDVRVMIAGGGPLEEELRTLARDLGVEAQVRFLGWQDDIAAVLGQADVLVLPSAGEPFGLAMVEASSQGLLTIAFADGGGVLETVAPGGHVVHSVDELAAVLENLRGSEALGLDARRARSSWTRQEFEISNTSARYAELYGSAMAKAR
jgi:glycosyltransferase involved in cell wall biosynthesis